MLDKDSLLRKNSASEFDDDNLDFHECLDRAKDLFEKDDGVEENFLESIDRYFETVESDK